MSLKRKSAVGVLWNISSSGFRQVVNFAVYILLARLVTVEEFGLVSFSFLIVEFVSIFMSVGVNQNLIRREKWCDDFASSSHWLLVIISVGISAVLVGIASPVLAVYYNESAALIILALAAIPVINSVGMAHSAKMQREFQNKKIAMIDSFSILIGGVISITLALLDYGAWSIVIGRVAQSFVSTLFILIYSDFSASFSIRKEHVKDTLNFGIPLFYMALLGFFSGMTTKFIVGVLFGPVSFAFITMAHRTFHILTQLTIKPMNKIMVATFPRVDVEALPETYYRILRVTAFFVFPVYLGLGAIADPFINFTVGEKWQPSIALMSIYGIGAPSLVLGFFIPTLMVTRGHSKSALYIKLVTFSASVTAPFVSFSFGISAMILAVIVANYLTLPIRYRIAKKHVPISLNKSIITTLPYTLAGFTMFFSVLLLGELEAVSELYSLYKLFVYIALGAIVYPLILIIFFRRQFLTIIQELKNIRK